jgi:endonuclease/exonuclease/phosphatase family metal-dependent hydrolase
MAFRKKYEPILEARPDVLILQECEHQEKLAIALADTDYRQIIWYGENPHKGIAAITYNNWTIESLDMHDPEYQYILPLKLSNGVDEYNLFVIWAMPHKTERRKDYVGQIYGAIHYYADLLDEPSILIGDFNSNAIFDKKRKKNNHQSVVKFLEEKQISSIYHLKRGYAHGEEPDPTLYLLKKLRKPYHMDYCFASTGLISESTTIAIGQPDEWLHLSDHMPLIIDNLG